ncbi:PAS sensor protein, partial [Streptomyces sp. NPDC058964]
MAAAPITTGQTTWGGLVLHWPSTHPPALSSGEREAIADTCHRLGRILQQAADSGSPVLAGPEPRIVRSPPARSA